MRDEIAVYLQRLITRAIAAGQMHGLTRTTTELCELEGLTAGDAADWVITRVVRDVAGNLDHALRILAERHGGGRGAR